MSETRAFRTVVVLTVATGTVMANGLSISDMHQLIGWLSGGPVWTHQLPLVREESTAAAIVALGEAWEPFDPAVDDHVSYSTRMVGKLGETIQVAPAAKPFHRGDAVIADAVEMVGAENVIVAMPEAMPSTDEEGGL